MLIFTKLDRATNRYYIWDSDDDSVQSIDSDELKELQGNDIIIYGLEDALKCLEYTRITGTLQQHRYYEYGTIYRFGDMTVWHNHNNLCVHTIQYRFPAYSYVFKNKKFIGVLNGEAGYLRYSKGSLQYAKGFSYSKDGFLIKLSLSPHIHKNQGEMTENYQYKYNHYELTYDKPFQTLANPSDARSLISVYCKGSAKKVKHSELLDKFSKQTGSENVTYHPTGKTYTVYHSEDKRVKDKWVFAQTQKPCLVSRGDGVDVGEKIISALKVHMPFIMAELNRVYKENYINLRVQYENYTDSLTFYDGTTFWFTEFLAILSHCVTDDLFDLRLNLIERIGVLDIAFKFTDIDVKTGRAICKVVVVIPSYLSGITSMSYLVIEPYV